MNLLKAYLLSLVLLLSACKEAVVQPEILKIRASKDNFEHFDTIYGSEIRKKDSTLFRYDNDNFKGSVDTLFLLKNRTLLMGKTLEFIRRKDFVVDQKSYEVVKYYYHGEGFHSFNMFFINPELGIILNTTYSDWMIEYGYQKNKVLIDEIKKDSIFLTYE